MHDPSRCRELINQQVQALYQCNKHFRMPLQSAGTTMHVAVQRALCLLFMHASTMCAWQIAMISQVYFCVLASY